MAKGLGYIHSESAVHGDLRLSQTSCVRDTELSPWVNVLLDANLQVQIADFGLTLFSDGTNTRSGALHVNYGPLSHSDMKKTVIPAEHKSLMCMHLDVFIMR